MAAAGGLPARDMPAYPGSLGSYAGNALGLTMVTYELDRNELVASLRERYLRRHVEALLTAVRDG